MKICMSKILTHIRSQQKNKRKKCRPHTHKHPTEGLSLPTFFYTNFLIGSIHFITTVFMWYSQVWLWKTNWGGFDLADFFLTFDCHIMFIYQDSAFCCLWLSLWQALFIEKKLIYKTQYVCMLPYKLLQVSLKTFLINV